MRDVGEFDRQAFTDGGVYDNLGLRMSRCLEQSWVRHATPLHKNDFLAIDEVMSALRTAEDLPEGMPLRRLKELVNVHVSHVDAESDFAPMRFETVDAMDEPDLRGFEVISESRVFDLTRLE